ncbi:integrase core domain-containing protein [Thioclava pacifica]|uniref:integrase core domain-containing protein n=1 Tax=Thioclava pacifica TaxID=285109 RepID=UPI000A073813
MLPFDEAWTGSFIHRRPDTLQKLEDWRRHYNDDRPHSAIGYNVTSALHFPDGVTCLPS